MARYHTDDSWVVYRHKLNPKHPPLIGVCLQVEWDEIQLKARGELSLIRSGVTSEREAEQLARTST